MNPQTFRPFRPLFFDERLDGARYNRALFPIVSLKTTMVASLVRSSTRGWEEVAALHLSPRCPPAEWWGRRGDAVTAQSGGTAWPEGSTAGSRQLEQEQLTPQLEPGRQSTRVATVEVHSLTGGLKWPSRTPPLTP